MTKDDIKRGRTFEAKVKKRVVRFPTDLINDRQVIYVGGGRVQYDSPTVSFGRHYPTVPMEKFLKWAARDVTDEMPKDNWRPWPSAGRSQETTTASAPQAGPPPERDTAKG